MIDISLNKALVAVEKKDASCSGCVLAHLNCVHSHRIIECYSKYRKDGKNVIFRLVDLPKDVFNEKL